MKRILLLTITSLAMLMADFTLIGEQLTPTNAIYDPVTDPVAGESSLYLEPVNIPAYDSNNPSHLLITVSNGKWTSANLNNVSYKHFYVEPGNYSGSTITLTADGTAGDRRSISLYNGNDIHPASLSESQQANVRLKWNNADYWTIDRLSNIDMSSNDVDWFYNGSSHNIVNRLNMMRYYYGVRVLHNSNYNTIQNSYFDHMTHAGRLSDNVAIALTTAGQGDGTTIIGTKMINNDFRNAGDSIQLVRFSDGQVVDYAGTTIDSNMMWYDGDVYTNGDYSSNGYNPNGEYQIGENALDFKRGSNDLNNPVVVTNNIMWGYKEGDDTAGGSWTAGAGKAITLHFGVKNFVFENNIIFDSQTMIGVSSLDPITTGAINNASFKHNIFYRSGQSNPDNRNIYSLYFYYSKDMKFENNTIVDFTTGGGSSAWFFRFENSYSGNTFKKNVVIAANGTSSANGNAISDNHYYDSSSSLGGTNNTDYGTASEASMTDYTFAYKRFTAAPKQKTLTGAISTVDSPHYGLAGSSITKSTP